MNYRCKAYRKGGGATARGGRSVKVLARCSSAVGILVDGGRVFIQRRPTGKRLAGLWEFPGGKRERGETPKQTVRRELREELGIEVDVGEKMATVRHHDDSLQLTVHFYYCRRTAGEIRPTAADAWEWAPVKDLHEYPFPEANWSVLETLAGAG